MEGESKRYSSQPARCVLCVTSEDADGGIPPSPFRSAACWQGGTGSISAWKGNPTADNCGRHSEKRANGIRRRIRGNMGGNAHGVFAILYQITLKRYFKELDTCGGTTGTTERGISFEFSVVWF